jgi:hypothetical protein
MSIDRYTKFIAEQAQKGIAGSVINEAKNEGWKLRSTGGDREVVYHATHPEHEKISIGMNPYTHSGQSVSDSAKAQLKRANISTDHPVHKMIHDHMVKKFG